MANGIEHINPIRSQRIWLTKTSVRLRLANLAIIMAIGVGGGFFLCTYFNSQRQTAVQHALDTAVRYHDNAWLIMSGIDSALRATNEWLDNHDSRVALSDFLGETAKSYTFVRTIIVVLPNGDVIGDSRPDTPAVGVNIADRGYIQNHVTGRVEGFDVDLPVQSRVDGAWSVPVSRAAYDADNNLQWIVVAALDPIRFAELALSNDMNQIGQGIVLNNRGETVSTIPFDSNLLTIPVNNMALLQNEAVHSGSGYLQGASLVGEGQSLIAYHRTETYPLTILTEVELDTIRRPFLRMAAITSAVFLILAALTTSLTRYQIQQAQNLRHQIMLRQQSDRRFSSVIVAAMDAIISLNADQQIVLFNPAAERMFGYRLEEVWGQPVDMLIPLQFHKNHRQLIKAFGKMEVNQRLKSHFRPIFGKRKSGEAFPIEASISHHQQNDGQLFTVILRDVTDRKLIEAELETQIRYQTAVAELGFKAVELENLQQFMDQFVQIVAERLGVEYSKILELLPTRDAVFLKAGVGWREGLVGQASVGIGDESQAGYTLKVTEPVIVEDLRTETRFSGPELLHAHGVISGMSVVIRRREQIYGVLGVHTTQLRTFTEQDVQFLQSVTGLLSAVIEHRLAVAELRKSEERWRSLTQYSPEQVLTLNKELKIQFANQPLPGLTIKELLNTPIYDYVVPERRAEIKEILENVLATGVQASYETIFPTPNGDIYYESIVGPMRDGDNIVGLTISARDITKRKQLEGQLRQSQKMEAVGRLAGGVAHDFNNILTIIGAYSQMLLDRQTDAKLKRYAQQVHRAGERAASLTRQLLAFSRRQVLQPKTLDLNLVVTELSKMLERLIGEDVDLLLTLEEGVWPVRVDASQIEQVVMNLAVNARDAMPAGGQLLIQTANVQVDEAYAERHRGLALGSYVMLMVQDTGVGMDAGTQRRMFEPFFTTKEAGQGTGLGLAMVHGIVTQSNGYIWTTSETGKGATFKIYLPHQLESSTLDEMETDLPPLLRGTERILLVEDDEVVRALAQQMLTEQGYTVLVASRGAEAVHIHQTQNGRIDLLLTDVVMPGGMNGRQVAEQLLAVDPNLKVLYMSGYTDDALLAREAFNAQMRFLQKPFSVEALLVAVRQVLDVAEPSAQLR